MKIAFFAAALMLGTASFAQDATQPAPQPTDQPSGETVDDPSQATGPQGVTQQGTDPNGVASAPAGTNQAPMSAPMGMPMSQGNMPGGAMAQPAGEYPACSRTVTDRCVQTYERGVRRARARR